MAATRTPIFGLIEPGQVVVAAPDGSFEGRNPSQLATTISMVAAAALSGHRAVAANSQSLAVYASSDTPSVLAVTGITASASEPGAQVLVQYAGEMVEPSWNWQPGPVWLGLNGLLTQAPPTSGALLQIGTALGATRLLIEIGAPVFL